MDALQTLTDEIEKAKGKGLLPRGGSARMMNRIRGEYSAMVHSKEPGKYSPKNLKRRARLREAHFDLRMRTLRKSDAPLDELSNAIEKARGLMPRGGTSRLRAALDRRQFRDLKSGNIKDVNRAGDAKRYLGTRYANNWSGAKRIKGTNRYWVRRGKYK